MPEVVATTPSSPLGACVVVRLDILPRKSGMAFVAGPRGMDRESPQPLVIRQIGTTFQALAGHFRNTARIQLILECLVHDPGRASAPTFFSGVLDETRLFPFSPPQCLRPVPALPGGRRNVAV